MEDVCLWEQRGLNLCLKCYPHIRVRISPDIALKKIKAKRDNKLVESLLEKLRKEAKDKKCNLMPTLIETVKAYATLGEICEVLREVFGEFKPQVIKSRHKFFLYGTY